MAHRFRKCHFVPPVCFLDCQHGIPLSECVANISALCHCFLLYIDVWGLRKYKLVYLKRIDYVREISLRLATSRVMSKMVIKNSLYKRYKIIRCGRKIYYIIQYYLYVNIKLYLYLTHRYGGVTRIASLGRRGCAALWEKPLIEVGKFRCLLRSWKIRHRLRAGKGYIVKNPGVIWITARLGSAIHFLLSRRRSSFALSKYRNAFAASR